MLQALVSTWGQTPVPTEVPTPDRPSADSSEIQLHVLATGINTLVRSRAGGKHYSARSLPHIPGVDGVGRDESTGKLYYFTTRLHADYPVGSFAQVINVPVAQTCPVPEGHDGGRGTVDDAVQIAGLMNPVMASWMALTARIGERDKLPEDWTAVVIGAAGYSGKAAVDVARLFGAKKVFGAARTAAKLEGMGLDGTIVLKENSDETEWSDDALQADIVLDFLWGPVALRYLSLVKPGKALQFVSIGSLAGLDMALSSAVMRSRDITIRGAGPGSWDMKQFKGEAPKMVAAIAAGKIRKNDFTEVNLANVEKAWSSKDDRIVIVP